MYVRDPNSKVWLPNVNPLTSVRQTVFFAESIAFLFARDFSIAFLCFFLTFRLFLFIEPPKWI